MLRHWCLARIVYSWFNNILLKPLTSQCLRTFQRSLWLAFFFGVLGLLFVLFWSCLSLFKFYISWIKAQGIHVTYPWVTVLCVNHKPTNHIFSVQCLFLLFISFLVCLTPHLFIFFVYAFSPSFPQNFHWPFSLRGSVFLLSTRLLYLKISWQSGVSFAYAHWTLVVKCAGAKDNIFLLWKRCCFTHKKLCVGEHRIME